MKSPEIIETEENEKKESTSDRKEDTSLMKGKTRR
jgi:hypothetical protein